MTHPPRLTQPLSPHLAFDLILVKGGTFRMGADKTTDPDAYEDEGPPHDVTVPDFYLGQYPVTQDIWLEIMGENPSFFPGDRRPVETVSWLDITTGDPETQKRAFLDILNEKTGRQYRLPTEAEWEYASLTPGPSSNGEGRRDSTSRPTSRLPSPVWRGAGGEAYAGSDKLHEVGWFADNSHGETKPVGLKLPNALGLYDMSGNVWEWCEDDWHSDYKNAPKDGSAWVDTPERGTYRVYRGGSWNDAALDCRSAYRNYWRPDDRNLFVGFRLALAPQ